MAFLSFSLILILVFLSFFVVLAQTPFPFFILLLIHLKMGLIMILCHLSSFDDSTARIDTLYLLPISSMLPPLSFL